MGKRLGWLLVAFLVGIAAHSIWPFTPVEPLFFYGSFGCIAFGCWLCFERRELFFWTVVVAACVAGVWRFDFSIPRDTEYLQALHGSRVELIGYVRKVNQGKSREALMVDVWQSSVAVHTSGGSFVEGATVRFMCHLTTPGISPFNLQERYSLARIGVWSACAGSVTVTTIAQPAWWDVSALLARWRRALTRRIQSIFPADEAELITGILYGDQNLNDTLRTDMQNAGLMPLVAVSGSNVTIVVTMIAVVLGAIGCRRRQAFWVTTVFLFVFTIFVGASASVLRAALMGWLALLAREMGRKPWPDRLLLIAAVGLALLNPWSPCFDAGFALSFLAMWGLLAWTPLFEARLKRVPRVFGVRTTVSMTLGATLMTAPYAAWSFGQMTLVGLLTNVLALPLVPWITVWGVLAAAWGHAPFFQFVSLPALGLANLIIHIAQLNRALPWLDLRVQGMDFGFLIACYFCIWWLWRQLRVVDRSVGEDGLSVRVDKKEATKPSAPATN